MQAHVSDVSELVPTSLMNLRQFIETIKSLQFKKHLALYLQVVFHARKNALCCMIWLMQLAQVTR
jgi:hypothetical protein